jgi:hypothetical protein
MGSKYIFFGSSFHDHENALQRKSWTTDSIGFFRGERFSRDGYCEREGKGKETFGMRRTGQKKANDVGKRGQQALVLLGRITRCMESLP